MNFPPNSSFSISMTDDIQLQPAGSIYSNSLEHKDLFARRACISGGLAGRAGIGG